MDGKLMRIFFIFTSLSRGVHGGFTIPPTLLFSLILNYKFKCIFLQSPLFLLFHSVVFFIFLCKCWEHTASPLFCLGSGGGWCHVCDVHILTQCYLFFCKYSQEKNSCCFLLFFFFSCLKLLWARLLFQLSHFQPFQVRRTSLFGGLLEKLFVSINRAYSSWFYLSLFYCFRLLFILADTSIGTFQRRESKVI